MINFVKTLESLKKYYIDLTSVSKSVSDLILNNQQFIYCGSSWKRTMLLRNKNLDI